jgi:hypothetical protein
MKRIKNQTINQETNPTESTKAATEEKHTTD